jgi:carbon-monoxide dehydrogenase medium subunit
MPLWREYRVAVSVDDALAALARSQGGARIIAGGTDLLLDIEQGRLAPQVELIDVTRVEEMTRIQTSRDSITLGAAVTHAQIIDNPAVLAGAACLVQACSLIGGPQVRHVATIGGNVAHALPAGDGSIALLALEAEVEIASAGGRRWQSLESLFTGPGQVSFDRRREILVAFRFRPCANGRTSAFRRIMRPQGVAIAILNMAIRADWEPDGQLADLRLAVGAAGPKPLRARQAEAALRGRLPEAGSIQAAEAALGHEVRLRTSPHRATEPYRRHLLGVLLRDVLAASRNETQADLQLRSV